MSEKARTYDLEDRTFEFARDVRNLVRKIPLDIPNKEDVRQLVRSSGSVAANYREANDNLSRKDFLFRVKVCRKESKESFMWLKLLLVGESHEEERTRLANEANELMRIFGAIVRKSEQ